MRPTFAVLLTVLAACGSSQATHDAETDRGAADAETGDRADAETGDRAGAETGDRAGAETGNAPDAASCAPAGEVICATGPRGAVVTTFGAGDCFAVESTGTVWQVPETPNVAAHALFCGDIAAVLGAEGQLDYPACGGITAITTPRCQQSGGGTGTPPARYEWYFVCELPTAGVCGTTIRFVEHGLTD